jgi:hypothetical protein
MTFANICEIIDHLDHTLDDNQILSILHTFNENQADFGWYSLPDVWQHAIIGGNVRSVA